MVNEKSVRDFARHYRHFGNWLSSAPLIASLRVIHDYIVYLQFATPLPDDIKTVDGFHEMKQSESHLFEWELDTVCRELFLHASWDGTVDLRQWEDLAKSIDFVKDLHNESLQIYPEILEDRLMAQLLRYQNLQFPWQRKPNTRWLIRYLKVFGVQQLNTMIEEKVGLPIEKILRIGLAMSQVFIVKSQMKLPIEVDNVFVTVDEITKFVAHFSQDLSSTCQDAANSFSIGDDFIYTRNPLVVKPLIRTYVDGDAVLICPIPTYLLKRIAEGLYYEICNVHEFSKYFGPSFQSYVGEALSAANRSETFTLTEEAAYYVGKQRKDTVDWICSDKSAHLFIECKTKRLTYGSKTKVIDRTALDADVKELAKAVSQTYKSLRSALDGEHPDWKWDGKPVFPVIVMIEDYYGVGLYQSIKAQAEEQLEAVGIDPLIIRDHPFTIDSIWNLELAALIMSDTDILSVMAGKVQGDKTEWDLEGWLQAAFREKFDGLDANLFPEAFDLIAPGLATAKKNALD